MADSGHTVMCGLERISPRVARALVNVGERVTIVAEVPDPALIGDAGDLRVLSVRDGSVVRWQPQRDDRLRAGHGILVTCSRPAWERLRAWLGEPAAVTA